MICFWYRLKQGKCFCRGYFLEFVFLKFQCFCFVNLVDCGCMLCVLLNGMYIVFVVWYYLLSFVLFMLSVLVVFGCCCVEVIVLCRFCCVMRFVYMLLLMMVEYLLGLVILWMWKMFVEFVWLREIQSWVVLMSILSFVLCLKVWLLVVCMQCSIVLVMLVLMWKVVVFVGQQLEFFCLLIVCQGNVVLCRCRCCVCLWVCLSVECCQWSVCLVVCGVVEVRMGSMNFLKFQKVWFLQLELVSFLFGIEWSFVWMDVWNIWKSVQCMVCCSCGLFLILMFVQVQQLFRCVCCLCMSLFQFVCLVFVMVVLVWFCRLEGDSVVDYLWLMILISLMCFLGVRIIWMVVCVSFGDVIVVMVGLVDLEVVMVWFMFMVMDSLFFCVWCMRVVVVLIIFELRLISGVVRSFCMCGLEWVIGSGLFGRVLDWIVIVIL